MTTIQPTHEVIANYASKDPTKFLSATKGDRVKFMKEQTKGWAVCINKEGKQGYLPTSYLRAISNQGTSEPEFCDAVASYKNPSNDQKFLPLTKGQRVKVILKQGGWWTCEDESGRKGLCPGSYLRKAPGGAGFISQVSSPSTAPQPSPSPATKAEEEEDNEKKDKDKESESEEEDKSDKEDEELQNNEEEEKRKKEEEEKEEREKKEREQKEKEEKEEKEKEEREREEREEREREEREREEREREEREREEREKEEKAKKEKEEKEEKERIKKEEKEKEEKAKKEKEEKEEKERIKKEEKEKEEKAKKEKEEKEEKERIKKEEKEKEEKAKKEMERKAEEERCKEEERQKQAETAKQIQMEAVQTAEIRAAAKAEQAKPDEVKGEEAKREEAKGAEDEVTVEVLEEDRNSYCVVLYDFVPPEGSKKLLAAKAKEKLRVVKEKGDWWVCQNALGAKGMCPSNFLKALPKEMRGVLVRKKRSQLLPGEIVVDRIGASSSSSSSSSFSSLSASSVPFGAAEAAAMLQKMDALVELNTRLCQQNSELLTELRKHEKMAEEQRNTIAELLKKIN
ncbi:uncharacterized protein MONOS_10563 [Monocercomonoides exilis]|uniref:uncharacterized protein n=1 Tax=Monocercomonoides exilis TaxID=2049356 RepID=UPI00355A3958|nr:hypothetical protein MONOS_10563 [Monocercomonoides exilis]